MSVANSDMIKRRRSVIWHHFTVLENSKKAKCLYCFQSLSFSAGSLGNLTRHLKTKHPTVSMQWETQAEGTSQDTEASTSADRGQEEVASSSSSSVGVKSLLQSKVQIL